MYAFPTNQQLYDQNLVFPKVEFCSFFFLLCRNLGVEEKHHKKGSFFLVFEGSGQFLRFDQLLEKLWWSTTENSMQIKSNSEDPVKNRSFNQNDAGSFMFIDTRDENRDENVTIVGITQRDIEEQQTYMFIEFNHMRGIRSLPICLVQNLSLVSTFGGVYRTWFAILFPLMFQKITLKRVT